MIRNIYDFDWFTEDGDRMHGVSAYPIPNTFNYRVLKGLEVKHKDDSFQFLFIFPMKSMDDDE